MAQLSLPACCFHSTWRQSERACVCVCVCASTTHFHPSSSPLKLTSSMNYPVNLIKRTCKFSDKFRFASCNLAIPIRCVLIPLENGMRTNLQVKNAIKRKQKWEIAWVICRKHPSRLTDWLHAVLLRRPKSTISFTSPNKAVQVM